MMIKKILLLGLSTFLVLQAHHSLAAGKLYRFPDENGIPTISRSLPPSAAQKGYDILDDQSLRLIERIAPALTNEQIAELEQQRQHEEEMQRQAIIIQQQQEKEKKRQFINDQNLLASYRSEDALIKERDELLNHRQMKLTETSKKQVPLKQKLVNLQQLAAEQELSGRGITPNLTKQLNTSQQEIQNNITAISQLKEEIKKLTEQYAADQTRLRELLQSSPDQSN
jgi:hypothetical protein